MKKSQIHKRLTADKVWQIVCGVAEKQIAVSVATEWLKLSRSRLYALIQTWRNRDREMGPPKLYQRPPRPQPGLTQSMREFLKQEMQYLREESPYFKGHFNFAHLSDECHKRFGQRLHRSTVRRWAIREGYFDPEKHKTSKPYQRFETGAVGMLLQHDTSRHIWLPHTERKTDLILTLDDHSRKILAALLVPMESAWHHLYTVRQVVERYGRPLAYYLDNHGIYGRPEQFETQFSRAMKQLEINLKFTAKQYPQAKGKVEKRFDYFQRRLPLLMERHHVTSLTKANEILREQVEYFNRHHIHADTKEIPDVRWNAALKEGRTHFRSLSKDIPRDWIFSLHYPRKVKSTGCLTFSGKEIYIAQAPPRALVTLMLKPPDPHRVHTEIFVVYAGKILKHLVIPTLVRNTFQKSKSMRSMLRSAIQLCKISAPRKISKEDILGNIGSTKH